MEEISAIVRKWSSLRSLSDGEVGFLDALPRETRIVPANVDLIEEGDRQRLAFVIQKGWLIRYKTLSDGRRQVINFVLPGDMVGLYSLVLPEADHSVGTLTEVQVGAFQLGHFADQSRGFPRLGIALAWCAGRDEGLLEQVVRLGRRSATERMAHILLELFWRLDLVGLTEGSSFSFPVTQEVLADALGLTKMYVNRLLTRLRQDRLIRLEGRRMILSDIDQLTRIADFTPQYLRPAALPLD